MEDYDSDFLDETENDNKKVVPILAIAAIIVYAIFIVWKNFSIYSIAIFAIFMISVALLFNDYRKIGLELKESRKIVDINEFNKDQSDQIISFYCTIFGTHLKISEKEYCFKWNDSTSGNNKKIINFIYKEFGYSLNSRTEIISNNDTIEIVHPKVKKSIVFNKIRDKVNLRIDDVLSHEFIVKSKDDGLYLFSIENYKEVRNQILKKCNEYNVDNIQNHVKSDNWQQNVDLEKSVQPDKNNSAKLVENLRRQNLDLQDQLKKLESDIYEKESKLNQENRGYLRKISELNQEIKKIEENFNICSKSLEREKAVKSKQIEQLETSFSEKISDLNLKVKEWESTISQINKIEKNDLFEQASRVDNILHQLKNKTVCEVFLDNNSKIKEELSNAEGLTLAQIDYYLLQISAILTNLVNYDSSLNDPSAISAKKKILETQNKFNHLKSLKDDRYFEEIHRLIPIHFIELCETLLNWAIELNEQEEKHASISMAKACDKAIDQTVQLYEERKFSNLLKIITRSK